MFRIFSFLATCIVAAAMIGCVPISPEHFPLEREGGPFITVEMAAHYLPDVGEMPEGVVLISEESLRSNEEIAEDWSDPKAALAELTALGRTGGRFRRFTVPGVFLGTSVLTCQVVVLKDAQSAREYIDLLYERERLKVTTGEYTTFAAASSPEFGEFSRTYYGIRPDEKEGSKNTYGWYEIAFQKYNALITVETYSLSSSGKIDEAIALARKIEEKLSALE